MFDKVRDVARLLELEVEEGARKDATGKETPLLAIKHGSHRVIVIPGTTTVTLLVAHALPAEAAEKLARLPEKTYAEFLHRLRRELLEGRSGYSIDYDKTKEPHRLRRLTLTQKIYLGPIDSVTVQRFGDAIQELVVLAVRANTLVGRTLASVRAAEGPGSAPSLPTHDTMYG